VLEFKKNNRVSGTQIAAELGLSQATVSRALSGNKRISKVVREQVQETAQRLGYVANATARTLVKGRSNIIGILTGGLHVERTAHLLITLDAKLRENSLLPHLFYTRGESDRIADGVRHLLEQGVDGLIIIGIAPSAVNELQQQGLLQVKPTVFIDDALAVYKINLVTNGYEKACQEVAKALIDQKRRNIFALWKSVSDTRLCAIKSLLQQFGQEDHLVYLPTYNFPSSLEQKHENQDFLSKIDLFLRTHPECDTIICYNDRVAFSLISILNHYKRKIPSEVAIIGYGNNQLDELIVPLLSTFATQPVLIARATVDRLLELIDNPQDEIKTIKIPVQFIQRETL
jgi:LacI family transcriptional regulator, galactose operon repressor